jgi:ATP-dependent RNA helicase DeaD
MSVFKDMGLSDQICKSIDALGYENPTPIQEKTIPTILESDRDIVALSQTGTGKTAAFGLPIIHRIDQNERKIQALVLAPTRELARQISSDLSIFAKYIRGFSVVPIYGGADVYPQIKALKSGCQIVVATPGRANDLIQRRVLDVSAIKWLVLDEADEMLNMGFKEELNKIISTTPEGKQTLLFSATMPREIVNISKNYMSDPLELTIGSKNSGAKNVQHLFYIAPARDRYLVLKRIVDVNPDIYGIVFCRTRNETKEVAAKLMDDGYNADTLHGDLTQSQRDYVMGRFRQKNLQILVATDVAARGLDVNNLSHVINYNLPDELEAYVHRSGRTGRAGKEGISVVITHMREHQKIARLEKMIKVKFTKMDIPKGEDVCEKQLFHLIDKVKAIEVDHVHIDRYLPSIYESLESLSREEIIQHFVSVEFNRFLEYYKNAPDLNVSKFSGDRDRGRGRDRGRDSYGDRGREKENWSDRRRDNRAGRDGGDRGGRGGGQGGFQRFFINIGKKDHLSVVDLIGLIKKRTNNRNIKIGTIDISKSFTFFEIEKRASDTIVSDFKGSSFNSVSVNVETAQNESNPSGGYSESRGDRGGERGGYKKKGRGGSSNDSRDGGFRKRKRNY